MREKYPRYAYFLAIGTPLMRESVPSICVEICPIPQRNLNLAHKYLKLGNGALWGICATQQAPMTLSTTTYCREGIASRHREVSSEFPQVTI
jgi:hypothetical protein